MTADVSVGRRPQRLRYETNPGMYRFLRRLFNALMHILYRYEIVDQANFPASGPVILVVNHLHLLDPLAVAPAVDRQIVTLAAEKYIPNILVGTLLRLAGVIFVHRGEVDREALRHCADVLSQGQVLAIAPEGTRSKTGAMQQGKPGIAYIAYRSMRTKATHATIVPIAIYGDERLSDWLRLKRPSGKVVVGHPFRLPDIEGKPTTEKFQELADLVMVKIGLLLPPSYRGVYSERIAAIEAGETQLGV
jgi:1-acyl-sn-glycerol-3-phosphate acyltransferase